MDALKSKGQMLDQINLEQIPRSGFDLSYSTKGTGKIGRIIPTRCMECLPSDSIKGSTQAALQFQPLAVPILANMRVKQETWYVPNHILLDNWDTFITKGQDLSDNSVLPSFSLFNFFTNCIRYFIDVTVGQQPTIKYYKDPYIVGSDGGKHKSNGMIVVTKDNLLSVLRNIKSDFSSNSVSNYFVKYQLDDLLDYRINLIDNLISYFSSYAGTYTFYESTDTTYSKAITGGILVFSCTISNGPMFHSIALTNDNYKTYSDYFDDLDVRLLSALSVKNPQSYVLSEPFKVLVQYFDDLLSPIVGAGSLFDYLGYSTISDLEWRYLFDYGFAQLYSTGIGSASSVSISFATFFTLVINSQVSTVQQNILPLRACYAIWYNNYRDKLLETAAPEPLTTNVVSTDEMMILCLLRIRAWSKDSFNTALSNTGTGNMVVPISQNLSDARKEYKFTVNSEEDLLDLNLNQFSLQDGTKIDLPTRFLSSHHSDVSSTGNLKYEFSLDTLRRAGRTEKWIQKALIYGNLIQDALFTHWGVKIATARSCKQP